VYANRFLKDPEAAKDMVITAFAKAIERRQDFPTFEKLQFFLYICVRNCCFNELKAMKRRKMRDKDYASSLQVAQMPQSTEIENAIEVSEVLKSLLALVHKLPPRSKVVFERYLNGISPKAIAAELNITVESVRSQKRYAFNLLRQMAEENNIVAAALSILLLLLAASF
jgi:RNA polymerase sigma-70 factor (ECF subfamily)